MIIENKREFVFHRATTGRIKISSLVIQKMAQFIQTSLDATEAGGVLLGRFILNSEDIVVDDITVPHKKDKRIRHCFIRNKRAHQLEIVKSWRESGGTCNYLGEWHTHPEPKPQPSSNDIKDWKRILKQARFDYESLFFVVVGTEQLLVFEGLKDTLEIKPLTIEVKEDKWHVKT
ncbi:Mov34/MPN/PAD-1 family protein [Moorellaceae bacterium AZ2]